MKNIFSKFLKALGAIFLFLLFLFLLLPYLADHYLIPHVLKNISGEYNLSISRVSPFSFRTHFSITDQGEDIISLPKIDLYYHPAGLFNGTINKLVLDHPVIHMTYDGSSLFVGRAKSDNTAQSSSKGLPELPAGINRLLFHDLRLIIHDIRQNKEKEYSLRIQGEIDINYDDTDTFSKTIENIVLHLNSSDTVQMKSTIRLTRTGEKIVIHSDDLHLSQLSRICPLLDLPESSFLEGSLQGSADMTVRAATLHPEKISVQLSSTDLILNHSSLAVKSSKRHPFKINLLKEGNRYLYNISSLPVNKPVTALNSFTGEVQITDKGLQLTGDGLLNFKKGKNNSAPIQGGKLGLSYVAAKTAENRLQAAVTAQIATPLQIEQGEHKYTIQTGSLTLETDDKGDFNKVSTEMTISGITATSPHFEIEIPQFSSQTSLNILKDTKNTIEGDIQISSTGIADSKNSFSTGSIKKSFLFRYSSATNDITINQGSYSINNIIFRGINYGKLAGMFLIKTGELSSTGKLTFPSLPKTPLTYSLHSNMKDDYRAEFAMTPFQMNQSNLASFVTLPEGLDFSALAELKGFYQHIDSQLTSGLHLSIQQGKIVQESSKLEIKGVQLDMDFDSLAPLTSHPSQQLTIDSISMGAISFSDAEVFLRLEKSGDVFIEKSKFHWCGGKVESGSLRLQSDMNEVSTTLYCDRLNFAQLLFQLGVEGTEGAGSLNGSLPLHISEKGIVFDNGFLFSTPGENGIIHFSNTDMLGDQIGATQQTGALSYSMQALKDFAYDWSHVTFTSKDDELTLSLKLQGKPAKPLPYGYKNGQIVQDQEGPGLQHPLHLNLNFNLPQEDIFQFGKNLQSLKENL